MCVEYERLLPSCKMYRVSRLTLSFVNSQRFDCSPNDQTTVQWLPGLQRANTKTNIFPILFLSLFTFLFFMSVGISHKSLLVHSLIDLFWATIFPKQIICGPKVCSCSCASIFVKRNTFFSESKKKCNPKWFVMQQYETKCKFFAFQPKSFPYFSKRKGESNCFCINILYAACMFL